MERPFGGHPCRDSKFESIIFRECKEWERKGEWEFLKAGFAARKATEDDFEWKEGVKDDYRIFVLGSSQSTLFPTAAEATRL